jgi:hypothetical protein
MIIGAQDDHRHYLDQLVMPKSGKLITATSSIRARSTRTAGATTSSAPSHTRIPSKRLGGSRRSTRLESRSSPESEQQVGLKMPRPPVSGLHPGEPSVARFRRCQHLPVRFQQHTFAKFSSDLILWRWSPTERQRAQCAAEK